MGSCWSNDYVKDTFIPTRHHRIDVPLGMRVAHNKNGTAFLVEATDDEARNEHNLDRLPVWASSAKIRERFGPGYQVFFQFLMWNILYNVVLFGFSLVSFIPHMVIDGWQNTNRDQSTGVKSLNSQLANLYISSYSYKLYPYWLASTLLFVVFWLVIPVIYAVSVIRFFKKRTLNDNQNHFGKEADIVESNRDVRWYNQYLRLCLSYSLFLLALFISFVISFCLVALEYLASSSSTSATWGPVLVSLAITVMNWIWYKVAMKLTSFEKHWTWSAKKMHATIKFYCFRVLNVLVLYLARWLVRSMCTTWNVDVFFCNEADKVQSEADLCGLEALGNQTFFLLIIMILARNIWHVMIYPFIIHFWKKYRGVDKKKGDRACWPAFDVAEEYLQILYRQFVTYIGLPVFPLAAVLSIIAGVVEYFLFKIKMLRLSKPPKNLSGSMRAQLVILLLVNAVLAVVAFPSGVFWMLAGFSFTSQCKSGIFWNDNKNCTISLFSDSCSQLR